MNRDIENVPMGQSDFHRLALATSGIDTCVAVVIALRGDGVVVVHVDPTEIFTDSPSVDVAARSFLQHCIAHLNHTRPGASIDGVYLIGGRDNSSYRLVSRSIDRLRTSVSSNASAEQAGLVHLREFLLKIKINLLTINIRPQRAINNNTDDDDDCNGCDSRDDYVSACMVIYDRTSAPAKLLIAQRADRDEDLNGKTSITSMFVIYKVDVESGKMSAITYPPLYRSPFSSLLVNTIRRNGIDQCSIFHRPFDLPADDVDHILLARIKDPFP
jgi:hypothetical protein